MNKFISILFIYIATVFYVLASYYHLSFKDWTFWKAFCVAVPLVIIEYCFSLRGNYYANTILKLNALQILLITLIFYFINLWILNFVILKNDVVLWKEVVAFVCIVFAFFISGIMDNKI